MREPRFGESQKDDAENGTGVFLRLETRVRAELIRGVAPAMRTAKGRKLVIVAIKETGEEALPEQIPLNKPVED